MKGAQLQSGALELATGGAMPVFRIVAPAGTLVLTDAEVVALAQAGQGVTPAALQLYMMSKGDGRGGEERKTGEDEGRENAAAGRSDRDLIAKLRQGQDVRVRTVKEARRLLDEMSDLRPATEERLMPNPPRGNPPRSRMSDGFEDPPGTYRGDLINKQDPTGPVHPDVANPTHRDYPHYNIKFKDGTKAAIIVSGE
jgi:hypothetical protein